MVDVQLGVDVVRPLCEVTIQRTLDKQGEMLGELAVFRTDETTRNVIRTDAAGLPELFSGQTTSREVSMSEVAGLGKIIGIVQPHWYSRFRK